MVVAGAVSLFSAAFFFGSLNSATRWFAFYRFDPRSVCPMLYVVLI
jgi:hypothetical protein